MGAFWFNYAWTPRTRLGAFKVRQHFELGLKKTWDLVKFFENVLSLQECPLALIWQIWSSEMEILTRNQRLHD